MMYQALYRKYRPSTFDDVVGQDVIIRTLKNAIENNKLIHAYLFTGPRGTGKTSTAKILAKTINCSNLVEFKPCNQCDSCVQINNKQTTDIIEIDAASNNGVDEIRELKNKANLVPSNSKYKVYIIDEVHMLSTGAFNALLKTLEEPPSHIIFILATTEPHKIPMTILSRCQRFDFKKISVKKIVENLEKIVEQENIQIQEEALKEIAVLSQGGMRDAISLLDQSISYCPEKITSKDVHDINGTIGNEELIKIVNEILNKDIAKLLKIFDELDENGKNLIKLVEELISFLKNILVHKISPTYFDESDSEIYEKINISINQFDLLRYIRQFSNAAYEMKRSDNEKITLELNIIEMMNFQSDNCKEIKEITKKEEKTENVKNTQIIQKQEQSEQNKEQTVISNQKIEEIKIIRINNALSCFNKKLLLEYKEKIGLVKKFLLNEKYGQWVHLIMDGELKALGKNYLIFVYKDEPMSYLFNQNWCIIEEILEAVYNEKLKVVATNIDDWNQIKQEFNSKTRIFEWKEEPNLEEEKIEKQENQKNEIETIFDGIIEYSE